MLNMIGNVCIFIIFIIIEVTVYQLYKNYKKDYEENTPIQTVTARVVTKKMDKYQAQRNGTSMALERYHLGVDKISDILADQDKLIYAARYYATFHTDQGKTIKFRVNTLEYEKLTEGELGILVFQGKNYISFRTE